MRKMYGIEWVESEKIKSAYRNNPLEKFGIHGSQEKGH